jgi:5-methylcytosine-specific restriction endonuclease McrA
VSRYALSHLADGALLASLDSVLARDRTTTAELLAHLAEIDGRRLYVPMGYPTMYAYCVGRLGFSEDVAFVRIRVARAGRRFHGIFDAIADGRLHLTAVVRLYKYLRSWNALELLRAAEHKTKRQVEELIAQRFPKPDAPTTVQPVLPPTPVATEHPEMTAPAAPGTALAVVPSNAANEAERVGPLVPEPVVPSVALVSSTETEPLISALAPASRTAPLSADRYALQLTVSRDTYDRLRRVQDLLASSVSSADLPEVFDRALKLLEESLEKRRFATTAQPRECRGSPNPRYVPRNVAREVARRDGGQCTFVSEDGHRCQARRWLEFDHVTPVARGGLATADNLRLRCRAHNQLAAEREFGRRFMNDKRRPGARGARTRLTPPATSPATRGLRGTRRASSAPSTPSGSRPGSRPAERARPSP